MDEIPASLQQSQPKHTREKEHIEVQISEREARICRVKFIFERNFPLWCSCQRPVDTPSRFITRELWFSSVCAQVSHNVSSQTFDRRCSSWGRQKLFGRSRCLTLRPSRSSAERAFLVCRLTSSQRSSTVVFSDAVVIVAAEPSKAQTHLIR